MKEFEKTNCIILVTVAHSTQQWCACVDKLEDSYKNIKNKCTIVEYD